MNDEIAQRQKKPESSTGKILASGAVVGLILLNPLFYILVSLFIVLIIYLAAIFVYGGAVGAVAFLSVIHEHPFVFAGLFILAIGTPTLRDLLNSKQKILALEKRITELEGEVSAGK